MKEQPKGPLTKAGPHPDPKHTVVPPNAPPQSTAHHQRVQQLINQPQGQTPPPPFQQGFPSK